VGDAGDHAAQDMHSAWHGGGRGSAEPEEKKQKRKQSGMHPETLLQLQKTQGPYCKPSFPTILELKQKCDQNESCTTFQALQLCFRV
jgi:hypothetical protein